MYSQWFRDVIGKLKLWLYSVLGLVGPAGAKRRNEK